MTKAAIRVVPTADWPRVVATLVAVGNSFLDDLEEAAQERVTRAADEARGLLLSMPSRGTGDRNARGTIAQHLEASVERQSNSIIPKVEVTGLPLDYQPLPRSFDKPRWRHPVYGNRAVWVTQYGKPWFTRTMHRHGQDLEEDFLQVMENAVTVIGRSG